MAPATYNLHVHENPLSLFPVTPVLLRIPGRIQYMDFVGDLSWELLKVHDKRLFISTCRGFALKSKGCQFDLRPGVRFVKSPCHVYGVFKYYIRYTFMHERS